MVTPSTLIKASLSAGKEFFRAPVDASERVPHKAPVMVPIRSIGPSHGERIEKHLLALDAHDRYLRFGYAASAEQMSGIGRVNQDIDGMNTATQQNAAMVEQAAANAKSLQEQAGHLEQVVSTFKLNGQAQPPSTALQLVDDTKRVPAG